MKTTATYTDYKVWRAALKATYPKAELRVSSGCHLDEYAALPNGKNVAWFGHDNNTGWIERASLVPDLSAIPGLDEPATLPKVNRALRKLGVKDTLIKGKGYYYFWGDDASEWYSSSVPVHRIGQLTLRQVLEEYFSLRERKGKTMSSKIKASESPDDPEIQFTNVDDTAPKDLTAAPKDAGNYTYFKLRSPKLTINRRGKPVVFKKGDPLGWRFSGSGKFLRLISPLTGPTIVYSIEINDDVLKWLDKQDPNSKRKRGQLKSDRPEDGQNRLEGYVVTDGTRYYKLEPKPIFSRKIKPRVIYAKEQDAKRFAAKFPQKKLKVKAVYTKDLGKVLSAATTTMPKMEFPGVKVTVPQALRKDLLSALKEMKVLSPNYISGYGDSSSTTWAVAFSIQRKFDLNKFQDQLREHLKYSGHLEVEYFDMVEED